MSPSISEKQRRAAGMALAAKRGKIPKKKLRGPARAMSKMSTESLRHFARKPKKGGRKR